MSLGHLPPRSQKAIVATLFGAAMSVSLAGENMLVSFVIAAAVLGYLAYLLGRSLEYERMREKKWYAQENHE